MTVMEFDAGTNFTNTSEVFTLSVPETLMIFLYGIICFVAIVGNGCVCYLVFSKRHMRTVTNFFIASLAISDMLMAIVCIPFTFVASLLGHWPYGHAFCPALTYIQAVVVFLSAYTMLAISIERYMAINHPFLRRLSKKKSVWVIFLCWILSFLTPLPTAITSRVIPYTDAEDNSTTLYCSEDWSANSDRFSYTLTIMVLQYFIPLLVLIYTYSRIVHIVWLKDVSNCEDASEGDPRKKVIKMMITVVGIYACCWLPLHVITIAEDVNPNLYDAEYMQMVWTAAHWLAMSSCVYNPIIYGWMNSKFREGFKNIILALRGQASIRRKPSWILPERKPLNHCDHGSKETFGSNQKAINLVLRDISENRQGKDTESIPLSVYTRNISSESLQKPEIV